MTSKSNRSRRRSHRPSHRQRPSTRPLELAQRRAQAVRDLARPLASSIESFLRLDEQLAKRRDRDRRLLAGRLLELVAGWGVLAMSAADGNRAGRLLASALIECPDESSFLWWVLEAAELHQAVRGAVAEGRRLAAGLELSGSDDFDPGSLELPEHLRQHLGELRAMLLEPGATTAAAATLAAAVTRELVEQRRTLAFRAVETDPTAPILASVSGILLGIQAPLVDRMFIFAADEMFEAVGEAVREGGDPGLRDIDPVQFFEGLERPEDEDEEDAGLADLDDSPGTPLRALLREVDGRLRFVEDPLAASRLAFVVAGVLCLGALGPLEGAPGLDPLIRVAAAAMVGLPAMKELDVLPADAEDLPEFETDETRRPLELACAVLESDLDLPAAESGSPDAMRELDQLVSGLAQDAHDDDEEYLDDDEEDEDAGSVVKGFGWAGAAVVAARLALELSSGDSDLQRSFAPLLAVLDPLALAAAHPELRAPTAASLRAHLSRE